MFCGKWGGWSKPFVDDGDEVWGLDNRDFAKTYCGNFIQADIRELDGYGFSDADLIIGSPPCSEFSIAKELTIVKGGKRDIQKGLELIHQFERFVKEARPDHWAMENVDRLEKWYRPPDWRFKMSKRGRRGLWTNIDLPLAPDYSPQRVFGISRETYEKHKLKRRLSVEERGHIPYPIARFVADSVKGVACI